MGTGAREELHLSETPEAMGQEDAGSQKISDYEQSRERRIRENLERMEKLGILDLSLKLKSLKPTPNRAYNRKNYQGSTPLPPSGPVRRSSRLQSSTPVSYCELQISKNDKSLEDDDMLRMEGSKPEVYTEEHEKLLGNTEMSWTLFVDGYGKDGKRIYDPVRGKTCHQCRQKTLGHRTHCSECNMVQGQFCGDCLYMRYGENVLEANKNPNWICPVCRGICNCSLCRQAKGWPPTGTLYRKISSLGYKSVAHYLVQTRRASTISDENAVLKVPTSAKRSLPFTDIDGVTMREEDICGSKSEHMKTEPFPKVNVANDESNYIKIKEEPYSSRGCHESVIENGAKPLEGLPTVDELNDSVEFPLIKPVPEKCVSANGEKKISPDASIVELKATRDTKIALSSVESTTGNSGEMQSESKASEEINGSSLEGNAEHTPISGDGKSGRSKKRNARDETGSMNKAHSKKDVEDARAVADWDSIGGRLKMRRLRTSTAIGSLISEQHL